MRMTCHRIGRPPISTNGLGRLRVCSCRRVPRPPQRMTTLSTDVTPTAKFYRDTDPTRAQPRLHRRTSSCAPCGWTRRWTSWRSAAVLPTLRRRIAGLMASATVDPGIFKAYDVRGTYPDQIDGAVAEQVGRGFVRVLAGMAGKPAGELRIGLGRDMRHSSPELSARCREGLVAEGAHVLDAGMIGTEMLYWLVGARGLDGGVMCTASHNPKAYTGLKLVREGALALSGDEGLQDIRQAIEAGLGEAPGGGSVEETDIYPDFHAAALGFVDAEVKPLSLVVEGSHGMAAPMVGPLLEQLGLHPVALHWQADGGVPASGPNPMLEENRRVIVDKVREQGAHLGIR